MSCLPRRSRRHRNTLGDADPEILPADPQAAGTHLELKGIHRARHGAARAPAGGIEDAPVAGADEPRLVWMPVNGTAQVRADRRQDGDVLRSLPLAADPDGVADAGLPPAVLVNCL